MGVEIQVGGQWKEAADHTPIGVISAFGGTVAPDGWFICDGLAKSRTTYADLYAVIGTNFGAGDGSTTFNLPDLRGRFLRGTDGAAGRDPDSALRTAMASGGNTGNNIGSVQTDAIQGHHHETRYGAGTYQAQSGITFDGNSSGGIDGTTGRNVQDPISDGSHGTPRLSAETRSLNAGVNFIIKY